MRHSGTVPAGGTIPGSLAASRAHHNQRLRSRAAAAAAAALGEEEAAAPVAAVQVLPHTPRRRGQIGKLAPPSLLPLRGFCPEHSK